MKERCFAKSFLAMVVLFPILLGTVAHARNPKINLFPHQSSAVDYMAKTSLEGMLIYHSIGTGKTITAIEIAERFSKRPIIVLLPRFLKSGWKANVDFYKVKNPKRYSFVSFLEAPKFFKNKNIDNSILIIDEIHKIASYVQSPDLKMAQEYTKLYQKFKRAHRVIGLTGTPIYQEVMDLTYIMNLVASRDVLPFNERIFASKFSRVHTFRSLWRGYFTESKVTTLMFPWAAYAAGLALVSNPVIQMAVFLSSTGFLPFLNMLYPPADYDLRYFDPTPLKSIACRYIAYYDRPMEVKDENFPTFKVIQHKIPYNKSQLDYYIDYADRSLDAEQLIRVMREQSYNLDLGFLTLNNTAIQERLAKRLSNGREIGNFYFRLGKGEFIEPPKFMELLKLIQKNKIERHVVYSNYDVNGIQELSHFFDRHGMEGEYKVLRPTLNVAKQVKIIDDFNNNRIRILLLHPEIIEGITLKGANHFHLLEPVVNQAIFNQIIGRAIRYKSHSHLPVHARHVDVHVWNAIIDSLGYDNTVARKENWLMRYSEMNDGNEWGKGLGQVDKNFERKNLSPDQHTINKFDEMEKAIQTTREFLEENSISSCD